MVIFIHNNTVYFKNFLVIFNIIIITGIYCPGFAKKK